MNCSHLLLCQCCPFVMFGLPVLMLTWPQSSVCTSSANDPLSSQFIFIAYLNLSAERYDRYRLKSFFTNDPSEHLCIMSENDCDLNSSNRSSMKLGSLLLSLENTGMNGRHICVLCIFSSILVLLSLFPTQPVTVFYMSLDHNFSFQR